MSSRMSPYYPLTGLWPERGEQEGKGKKKKEASAFASPIVIREANMTRVQRGGRSGGRGKKKGKEGEKDFY